MCVFHLGFASQRGFIPPTSRCVYFTEAYDPTVRPPTPGERTCLKSLELRFDSVNSGIVSGTKAMRCLRGGVFDGCGGRKVKVVVVWLWWFGNDVGGGDLVVVGVVWEWR